LTHVPGCMGEDITTAGGLVMMTVDGCTGRDK
jgi:hypothetical protein